MAKEGLLKPGLYLMTVYHDDWCPLLLDNAECTCQPTIETTEVTDTNADVVAKSMASDNQRLAALRRARNN